MTEGIVKMKKLIKSILACGVAACALPMVSYADFNVTNHSKASATSDAFNASTGYQSPCSSYLGATGIMEPNSTIAIPDWTVNMVCAPKCQVNVYMDRNCKARKIATVTISPKDGIGEPNNLPNAEGFYLVKKSKTEMTIEGGVKASIFDRMFRQLGV
jgi:hypothetical protein